MELLLVKFLFESSSIFAPISNYEFVSIGFWIELEIEPQLP